MYTNTYKKIKIAAVAPPFSGHLYPLLSLLLPLLKEKKYDIYIYSGNEKRNVIEKLGFNFKAILKNMEDNIFSNIANTERKTDIFLSYKQLIQNIKLINKIIPELKNEFITNKFDIVIADFIAVPVGIVCNELAIPWITTIPTPFAIENKSGTPAYLGGLKPRNDLYGKIRDFFARKIIRLGKSVLYFLALKKLDYKNFKLYNKKNEENIYSPFCILGLGMKELEFRDDFPEQFLWIGPCILNSKYSVNFSRFLNSAFKKKVLITIGTHLLWGKDKIIELTKYLANFYPNIAFIISLGNDKIETQETILKNNVFIYNFLEYEEILPKVDYAIHHGGAGILYSCIKFNKPALIIPHDYDQFDYAVRAEITKIALIAKTKKKKLIQKAFDKLIKQQEWENLDKLSKKLIKYNSSDILKSEINRILEIR